MVTRSVSFEVAQFDLNSKTVPGFPYAEGVAFQSPGSRLDRAYVAVRSANMRTFAERKATYAYAEGVTQPCHG